MKNIAHVCMAMLTLGIGCSDEMIFEGDAGVNPRPEGGVIPRVDGGGGDVPTGPTTCMSDGQCDDGNTCTTDTCVANTCRHSTRIEVCACDPSCMPHNSGGMGGMPFTPEGQHGVEVDMAAGGLVVRANSMRQDYLWIPNTNESTLSKWDATTGRELGRYRVGLPSGECRGRCCHENGCNMPSRTVVDGHGDAYVANRGFAMQGTVSKIAAETRDCVDRNMNGMIDTSSGPMDVKPFGADECVLYTVNVGPVNAVLRSLAIDRGDEMFPEGYPWVGSCASARAATGNAGLFQLNPRTGAVIRPVAFGRCAYGATVTPDGTLWEHGIDDGITPVNTVAGTVGTHVPNPAALRGGCGGSYGITGDAQGRIWLSGYTCNDVIGYDPMMRAWTRLTAASVGANGPVISGITVDPMNRVVAPIRVNPFRLVSFDASAFVPNGTIPAAMARVSMGVPNFTPSALGADRAGNIWVATADPTSPLVRHNLMTGTNTMFAGPNRVYTYTDFTGAVRRLVIGDGTYTQDYEACEMPRYAELTWDAVTPPGTTLQFQLRVADTAAGLAAAMPVTLATAPTDMSPVNVTAKLTAAMIANPGRFARLTVTFTPSRMPVASPVLRGLGLSWRCGGNPG